MNLSIYPNAQAANSAAAQVLSQWLTAPGTRNVMLPGGNTPLQLYGLITDMRLPLSHLRIFALDEYVGVPPADPRNCANLIRRKAVEPWGVPARQYFGVSSAENEALASVQSLERRIQEGGGLDVVLLGLGQNGHLGFNEPGSAEDSGARVLELQEVSVQANRQWFGGEYAPSRGATSGLRTILAARRIMLLAYGPHKRDAVRQMTQGPRTPAFPASLLQGHTCARVFVDSEAAGDLTLK